MIQQNNLLTQKIKYVENKFMIDCIGVSNEWLSGCIEFFCSENQQITNDELFRKAKEQWLLADLTEISEGCLPTVINSKKDEFVLDKKYPVQMQWLIDVAEPFYDQLRNLYNKKLDDVEEVNEFSTSYNKNESKKKRMLKLELTDGKIVVNALEYSPIPCLTTKLTPGSKILITGPLRCVNKILFLQPKNVKVLGGEVDTLLISNAYENILLKNLGKPINPNPKTEYKESIVSEEIKRPVIPQSQLKPFVATSNSISMKPIQTNRQQEHDIIMDDDDVFLEINLDEIQKEITTNSSNINRSKASNIHVSDEVDFDDIDMLNDIENEIKNEMRFHNQSSTTNEDKNPFFIQQQNHETFSSPIKRDPPVVMQHRSSPILISKSPTPPPSTSFHLKTTDSSKIKKSFADLIDHSNFFDSSLDFDALDGFEQEKQMEIEVKPKSTFLDFDYAFQIDGCNLATTEQLLECTSHQKENKEFMVYCEIDSVAEKLQIKNNEFCLGVFLKDYTDRLLQARFHTNVLSKLAEYTPKELQLMRHEQKNKPQIKTNIGEILSKLKSRLQEIKSFMKLSYNSKDEYPIIIELIDSNNSNKTILNQKQIEEK